jgi:hypothetical protein
MSAAYPDFLPGDIERNSKQPGGESRLAFEPPDGLKNIQKNELDQVIDIFAGTEQQTKMAVNTVYMSLKQLPECHRVPFATTLHQPGDRFRLVFADGELADSV